MPGYVPPPPARVEDGREVEGGGGQVGDRDEGLAYPLIEQGIAAVPFRGKGLGFRVGRSTHCWSARHSPSGCPAERRRAARRGRRTSD